MVAAACCARKYLDVHANPRKICETIGCAYILSKRQKPPPHIIIIIIIIHGDDEYESIATLIACENRIKRESTVKFGILHMQLFIANSRKGEITFCNCCRRRRRSRHLDFDNWTHTLGYLLFSYIYLLLLLTTTMASSHSIALYVDAAVCCSIYDFPISFHFLSRVYSSMDRSTRPFHLKQFQFRWRIVNVNGMNHWNGDWSVSLPMLQCFWLAAYDERTLFKRVQWCIFRHSSLSLPSDVCMCVCACVFVFGLCAISVRWCVWFRNDVTNCVRRAHNIYCCRRRNVNAISLSKMSMENSPATISTERATHIPEIINILIYMRRDGATVYTFSPVASYIQVKNIIHTFSSVVICSVRDFVCICIW